MSDSPYVKDWWRRQREPDRDYKKFLLGEWTPAVPEPLSNERLDRLSMPRHSGEASGDEIVSMACELLNYRVKESMKEDKENYCKKLDFHDRPHGAFTDQEGRQVHPHNGDELVICPKCVYEADMQRKWR